MDLGYPRGTQNLEPSTRPQINTFSNFPHLPYELRLLIWEHTWPAARVIEVAACTSLPIKLADAGLGRGFAADKITILRPCCSLSRALKEDLVDRTMDDRPLEYCPDPVALRVCHESRMHTLTQFSPLSCFSFPARSLYANWNLDMLYLSIEYRRHKSYSETLQATYGGQLGKFKTLLVEDFIWQEEFSPKEYIGRDHNTYNRNFLATSEHLKTIRIIFTQSDYSSCRNADGESFFDMPYHIAEAREVACRLDEEYSKACLAHPEWTPRNVELVDRSGKIYVASWTTPPKQL